MVPAARWLTIAVACASCDAPEEPPRPTDADADTDADGDADTDTDADTDVEDPCDREPPWACYASFREEVSVPAHYGATCGFDAWHPDLGRTIWTERHAVGFGTRFSVAESTTWDERGHLLLQAVDHLDFDGAFEVETAWTWGTFLGGDQVVELRGDGHPGADAVWGSYDDEPADGAAEVIETFTHAPDGLLLEHAVDDDGDALADRVEAYAYATFVPPPPALPVPNVIESITVDGDGDGTADEVHRFTWTADSLELDLPDLTIDYDGDGAPDTTDRWTIDAQRTWFHREIDLLDVDLDGLPDADGVPDYVYDHRRAFAPGGVLTDTVEEDEDGDGTLDRILVEERVYRDGALLTASVRDDTDGDGDLEEDYTLVYDPYTGWVTSFDGIYDLGDPYGSDVIAATYTYDDDGRLLGVAESYGDPPFFAIEQRWVFGGECAEPRKVDLEVIGQGLRPATEGAEVAGQLVRDWPETRVYNRVTALAVGGAFELAFPSSLEPEGVAYHVDLWVDTSGDGFCGPGDDVFRVPRVVAAGVSLAVTLDVVGMVDPAACTSFPMAPL